MICEKCGMRLIDADALPHDFTVPRSMDSRAYFKGVQDVFETIDAAPTVPAEVVRYGRWREIRDPYGKLEGWIHEECGFSDTAAMNYCASCGARMDLDHLGDTTAMVEKEDSR
jgi:hypothetical protein